MANQIPLSPRQATCAVLRHIFHEPQDSLAPDTTFVECNPSILSYYHYSLTLLAVIASSGPALIKPSMRRLKETQPSKIGRLLSCL